MVQREQRVVAGQNETLVGPRIGVTLPAEDGLNSFVLLLDEAGQVAVDSDLVFFKGPRHPSGAVLLGPRTVDVIVTQVPARIHRVIISVTTERERPLSSSGTLQTALRDGANDYHFTVAGLGVLSAAVLFELYRRGSSWKFRAKGDGWETGVVSLLTTYGIRVEPPTVPATPTAAAPRTSTLTTTRPSRPPTPIPTRPQPVAPAQPVAPRPRPRPVPTAAAVRVPAAPVSIPPPRAQIPTRNPGWYPSSDRAVLQWWNGTTYTGETQPNAIESPTTCGRCGRAKVRRRFLLSVHAEDCEFCTRDIPRQVNAWLDQIRSALHSGQIQTVDWANIWTQLAYRRLDQVEARRRAEKLFLEYLDDVVRKAFADGIIEQHEIDSFEADVRTLELSQHVVAPYRERLRRGQALSYLKEGQLPAITTSLHLESDETVYLDVAAVQIRVLARGPREDRGRLVVSSKKLRFIAPVGGLETPWVKIMGTSPDAHQVEVFASSARGGGIFEVSDPEYVDAVITGAARLAKRLVAVPTNTLNRSIPQHVKAAVWQRDGGCCVQCASTNYLEYDHIIPFSKGGANTVGNVQLLCRRCNLAKGDRL